MEIERRGFVKLEKHTILGLVTWTVPVDLTGTMDAGEENLALQAETLRLHEGLLELAEGRALNISDSSTEGESEEEEAKEEESKGEGTKTRRGARRGAKGEGSETRRGARRGAKEETKGEGSKTRRGARRGAKEEGSKTRRGARRGAKEETKGEGSKTRRGARRGAKEESAGVGEEVVEAWVEKVVYPEYSSRCDADEYETFEEQNEDARKWLEEEFLSASIASLYGDSKEDFKKVCQKVEELWEEEEEEDE